MSMVKKELSIEVTDSNSQPQLQLEIKNQVSDPNSKEQLFSDTDYQDTNLIVPNRVITTEGIPETPEARDQSSIVKDNHNIIVNAKEDQEVVGYTLGDNDYAIGDVELPTKNSNLPTKESSPMKVNSHWKTVE